MQSRPVRGHAGYLKKTARANPRPAARPSILWPPIAARTRFRYKLSAFIPYLEHTMPLRTLICLMGLTATLAACGWADGGDGDDREREPRYEREYDDERRDDDRRESDDERKRDRDDDDDRRDRDDDDDDKRRRRDDGDRDDD